MLIHEKIKLVLADEQNFFKEGLKRSLKKCTKVDVVGEASNEEQLIRLITEKQPDIVLIDLHCSEWDCVAFIRRSTKQYSSTRFIILSQHLEESLIVDAIAAGASGYLLKDSTEIEILKAIEIVHHGGSYYCNRIASKIIKLFGENGNNCIIRKRQTFTDIEKAIIEGICSELTNKEIAEKVFLSIRTVEGHRLHILRKIKVKGTAGIVIYAIKQGMYNIKWQMNK